MKKITYLLLACIIIYSCENKKDEEKKMPTFTAKQVSDEVNKVIGIANVEPIGKILPLSSEVNGTITKILVEANDDVSAGQVLVMLDYKVEEAQLAQAKSKLTTQQAAVNTAKANVAPLEVKLRNAENTYQRNQRLLTGNATTQQVVDDSRFVYEQVQKDLQASQALIAQQESKMTELQADINYFQTLLDRKTIKAPSAGKVLSIDAKIGGIVTANTILGEFAPAGALVAVTEIDELFADKIKIGQKAQVRNQGSTDILGEGKVIFTAPYLKKKSLFADKADNLEDRRVREVRVELLPKSQVLIGSRLECVIELK